MAQLLWKITWQFFEMLNMELPYGPAISFPGIYPKELKMYVHTNTLYTNVPNSTTQSRQKMGAT